MILSFLRAKYNFDYVEFDEVSADAKVQPEYMNKRFF